MLPRVAVARANNVLIRRATTAARRTGNRPWRRFQSTSSGSGPSVAASHVAAGVAGGATVVLAGYAYYHTSGLKAAVQTSKEVKAYLQSTRDSVVAKTREVAKNPSRALEYLRGVAKSYSSFIPGASVAVDSTFDQLEELHQTHGEELDKILSETTDEIQKTVSKGSTDVTTATKIFEIVRKSVGRMQEVGKRAGRNFLDKNPLIKEKLGGAYDQLLNLAERGGPEANRIVSEVRKQITEITSKGSVSEDSVQKLRQLVQEKTEEVRKLAGQTGGRLLENGSEKLQTLLNAIPGGDEIKEKVPHLQDVMNLASERNEEAKKLAKETYQDVLRVLEEKGRKAKEVAENAKADAEKKSKS